MQKFNYQKGNKATGKIYIGLDHGYGNIKTAHRVFQTGIECYDEGADCQYQLCKSIGINIT